MTTQDWLARLGPSELPAFRATLTALDGLRRQGDNVTAGRLASLILTDPYLSLRVLYTANNRPRHEPNVTTVEHALMMSGVQGFFDGLRHVAQVENTALGRDARALARVHALLRQAQHAAWQARDFAVLHRDTQAEEIQVAALLAYAPAFLLWLKAPEEARRMARQARKSDAATAETALLGLTLAELRDPLLAAWRLPELTRDLLQDGEHPRKSLLHASLAVADHSLRGWWAAPLQDAYLRLANQENLPLDNVIATVHGNAARAARQGDWIPAAAVAAWLVLEPGDWPEEADDDPEPQARPTTPEPAASQAQTPRAAPAPVQPAVSPSPAAPEEESAHICPMPDKQALQESLSGIESHLDHSLNMTQMSAIILKGLHQGLGLSRIVFAMVTPDGKRVKGRFSLGIPTDDPLRHFEFDLEGKDLFGQLMRKMQGVWVNQDNRERLWAMVGPRQQKMIGVGDFYAMSLLAGTRPIGLIYADRGHGDCGLDPLTYTDFKMLCLQAARGLAQVKG